MTIYTLIVLNNGYKRVLLCCKNDRLKDPTRTFYHGQINQMCPWFYTLLAESKLSPS